MTYAIAGSGLDALDVTVDGRHVRAFVGGEGPPVALVHGLGGGAANWVDVVPALVPDHRVVVPDLPGHGGSERPRAGASLRDYADALAGVLERLAGGPALVVGHSFGGHVSLRLAERHPELVRSLLLVVSSSMARWPLRTRVLGSVSTALRPGAKIAPLALRLAGRPRVRSLLLSPLLAADGAAMSPSAMRGFFAQMRDHRDVRAAFRAAVADRVVAPVELHRPALLLWGAADRVVPPEDGVALARLLGVPIRFVAGCGHLVPGERPDAVVDAIRALEGA